MEETLAASQITKQPTAGKLAFVHLPNYARFIKENILVPYIKEQITIAREINLPMLKFFDNMGDDELIAMAMESHREFLTCAENNMLGELAEKSLKSWEADELGVMKRHEITAEDIILSGYMRKKALIKYLPSYTTDVNEAIEITREIDILTVEGDLAATNIYIKLLKNRINEQAFFTEVLSNTTPGLNYIFDLKSNQILYANNNAVRFFGTTMQEMIDKGRLFIKDSVFSGDMAATTQGLRKCANAQDNDVVTWECRLKGADGKYLWMRNYSSVYKRDEKGLPTQMVGIILNIDVEKAVADKLLLREKQLLEAQAQTELGSFELDVATGHMDVTPQFKKIYELDDFDLYKLIDNVHPEDRGRINENRDKAIRENSIYDNEYRYTINGKEKILWTRGTVVDRNGRKIMIGTAMDVTNRHKTLQELLESRDLYRQAQELSHIGNWNFNFKTKVFTWSEEIYRIYEMDPHATDVNPDITRKYRHQDDVRMVDEAMRKLMQQHEPCDYTFRIILPSGTLKYLHVKGEVACSEKGEAQAMFGTIQDVTEKQLLIEKLQASDTLYKQAQAISHIGNWSWDLTTKKLKWSDELYSIYELEPQEVDTNTALAFNSHPHDTNLIRDTIAQSLATLVPFDFNYRIILKSGNIKTLNARGEIEAGADGKPVKIYGTVQDITEQKNAERRLKESQEFTQKITDTTPSIIASYNINTGRYSFINKSIETQLGYMPSQVMEGGAAFLTSIVHPDDLPVLMERNERALQEANSLPEGAQEPIFEFKYRMKNIKGEYRWFHTYGTIFERDEARMVESVLNITMDVTEQEDAEHTLFEKNLQLQQSNTSLVEYAYIASHDLKEPLRKIMTFSDRILTTQGENLSEEGRAYLNKIIDASRRMQKMTSDLLYVSTISGNKDFQMSDLNILLQDAILPLDHKIEELQAEIDADNLPMISVVPSQFTQMFQNLIGNSLKFTRPGVIPHIKIKHNFLNGKAADHMGLIKAKKYLRIEIQDNGIGFDDRYAEKIFAIFQRLHGKSEYEGTGLGLAVCKKIVENHGGVISAKGVLNHGATITIIIPTMY